MLSSLQREKKDIIPTLTGGPELSVQTFRLDTLEAKAHAHECETDESQSVRPSWISPVIGDARLATLPNGNGSSHCE